MGCYVNNLDQHEFNSFAAHLDPSLLTPQLCVKACSAISFNLAAIESGAYCFCKQQNVITSQLDTDASCLQTPCAGDSALSCGSDSYLMVYAAGPLSTVNTISIIL